MGKKIPVRDGKKLCRGLTHEEPTWLPLDDFYYQRRHPESKLYYSNICKKCYLARRRNVTEFVRNDPAHGYVDSSRVKTFAEELVARLGKEESARRSGVTRQTLSRLIDGTNQRIQARTFRRIALALLEVRANREAYHIKSIRRGVLARGEKGKPPPSHYSP